MARLYRHTVRNVGWVSDEAPWCPACDAPESHPDGDKILIRGYKVDNLSQCLVCSGYYDDDLNVIDPMARTKGGWFS
jgi:hypothetical protein